MQAQCENLNCLKTLNAHSLHDAIAASQKDQNPKCSYCGYDIKKPKISIQLGQ
jgi:aspartate carbamoyltransferase regulatory subunit